VDIHDVHFEITVTARRKDDLPSVGRERRPVVDASRIGERLLSGPVATDHKQLLTPPFAEGIYHAGMVGGEGGAAHSRKSRARRTFLQLDPRRVLHHQIDTQWSDRLEKSNPLAVR